MEKDLKDYKEYWAVIQQWENAFAIYASKLYNKADSEEMLSYIRLEVFKKLVSTSFYNEKMMFSWIQNAYQRQLRKVKHNKKECPFMIINDNGDEVERNLYDLSGKFDWSVVDKPSDSIFSI